jgi:hypothetical protein
VRDLSCAIVSVSFNSATPLQSWEETDSPVKALCRRIAFAALKREANDETQGERFVRFMLIYGNVDTELVVEWLGAQRCILLIDELNKVQMDSGIAKFLKNNFLLRAGRGLVFFRNIRIR